MCQGRHLESAFWQVQLEFLEPLEGVEEDRNEIKYKSNLRNEEEVRPKFDEAIDCAV